MFGTALPFRPTTISPKRMPACAAGPPATALRRKAPSPLGRPSDRASGSSRGSISMPSQPFWASLGWLPSLTCNLSRRPCGWAGSLGLAGIARRFAALGRDRGDRRLAAVGRPLRHAHDVDAAIGHVVQEGGDRQSHLRRGGGVSRLRASVRARIDADADGNPGSSANRSCERPAHQCIAHPPATLQRYRPRLPVHLELAERRAHAQLVFVDMQAALIAVVSELAPLAVEANARSCFACRRSGRRPGRERPAWGWRGGRARGRCRRNRSGSCGLCRRTRAGAAAPGVGAGAVIGTRAVSTTDAGADACTGIAASNVQPPTIPTATAAKPPITRRVFDSEHRSCLS